MRASHLCVALAVIYSTGCIGENAGLLALPPLTSSNVIPCSLAEVKPFDDYADVGHRSYGGPIREREEVAVLVTHNNWFARSVSSQLDLQAVDGQSEVQGQVRWKGERAVHLPLTLHFECGGECFRLAVLPGRHIVALSAVSEEPEKRKSRHEGQAEFVAEAGGLYSLHVCRTKEDGRVFWVRDERSQACVSGACPGK